VVRASARAATTGNAAVTAIAGVAVLTDDATAIAAAAALTDDATTIAGVAAIAVAAVLGRWPLQLG
jgi:hypothetical protein